MIEEIDKKDIMELNYLIALLLSRKGKFKNIPNSVCEWLMFGDEEAKEVLEKLKTTTKPKHVLQALHIINICCINSAKSLSKLVALQIDCDEENFSAETTWMKETV